MERRLIVLGLSKTEGTGAGKHSGLKAIDPNLPDLDRNQGEDPPARIADALLSLISEQAKQVDPESAAEFCPRLGAYRRKLWTSPGLDPGEARACISDCEDHFRHIRSRTQRTVVDFSELIELLKEAFLSGMQDDETFHERVFTSSDRFKGLAQLNDITEIKGQLAQLVRELRQTVIERQQKAEEKKALLTKRVAFLEGKLEAARQEAVRDPLTGIANRGGFNRTMRLRIDQARPFLLGMIDVDHFKAINDEHGHGVGDAILVCAAQWVGEKMRPDDLLARFGGDEFAVLMESISLADAVRKFTDLLKDVQGRKYVYTTETGKRSVEFTLSCGFTEFHDGDTSESLIQRADEALYEAKKQRNSISTKRRSLLSGVFGRRS